MCTSYTLRFSIVQGISNLHKEINLLFLHFTLSYKVVIGRPIIDKGTSVFTFIADATAAMFSNADDNLSNWAENPSQYN